MHMGEHGKGLLMKICHNALIAQIQNGVNETLALALREGIDIDKFSADVYKRQLFLTIRTAL